MSPTRQLKLVEAPIRPILITMAAIGLLGILLTVHQAQRPITTIDAPVTPVEGQLSIDVPTEAQIDTPIVISIRGANPTKPIHLHLLTSYGRRSEELTPSSPDFEVELAPFDLPASGIVLATAVQGENVGTAEFEVVPGPPVDPIDVYLGARTVIADGQRFVMHVSVPQDQLGNPVAEGTQVNYRVFRPNGVDEILVSSTQGLIAAARITANTKAGMVRVIAESGAAAASERTFLQVAGRPASVEILEPEPLPLADGSSIVRVQTDQLVDEFDNTLPDGVTTHLLLDSAEGISRFSSVVIDGNARFEFAAPDRPGPITLIAVCDGVQSAALTLVFEGAVDSIPISVIGAGDVSRIVVGPVLTRLGGYVPDGTSMEVVDVEGHRHRSAFIDGIGSLEIDSETASGGFTVEVLGAQERYDG